MQLSYPTLLRLIGIIGLSSMLGGHLRAADAEQPDWDVQDPPGDYETVTIKTDEMTWSNVDISPDGRTLVFDMLGDLYTVPTTGGRARALTEGLAWDFQPRFSPDGRQIAFISDRGGADNIWLYDLDEDEFRQVSKETSELVHNPYFSPDGRYIAVKKSFLSRRSIPGGEIWLYHVDGGTGSQVRERLHGKGTQKNIAEPAFSPDGRYLYYSVDNTAGKIWQYNKNSTDEIFVIRRWDLKRGEEETFISGPGGAIRPTPSPDGRLLAFVKRVDFQSALYVKNLQTGVEKQVYLGLDRDLQESDGSLGNTPHFTFTPDSQELIFWAKGKIRRLNLTSGKSQVIPIQINAQKQIAKALRYPVNVAPEQFTVKMPRWLQRTPDGGKLIFQALGYLYEKNLGNGRFKRLTQQQEHFEFYPAFSRDGQKLVYTTWNDQSLGHVRVLDLASGVSRIITPEPGHYVEPQFNPDGTAVVYRKITGGYLLDRKWSENPGVYYKPLDGKTQKLAADGYSPHFGQDPERIYLTSLDGSENSLELFSVDLKGTDKRVHFKGEDLTGYRVSPNGKWLAFKEQFKAYIAPFMQTGKAIKLNAKSKTVPVKQISTRAGEVLEWTPNSQTLFWSHGPKFYERDLAKTFTVLAGDEDDLAEPSAKVNDLNFVVKADQPQGRLALKGARVVTMRNADQTQEVIERGTILIDGNRIAAIGPVDQVRIPDGVKTIDVSGQTIIPGLIDVHAHGSQGREELTPQQNWKNFSSIAFGVTTIHDPSNDTSEIFAAAELQKAGRTVGPRIFSTGTILYGAYAAGATAKIKTYEDAKFHVQRLKDVGAITVKSYQQPMRSQRQMVVEAGRELGIMVVPEGGAKFQYNMGMIADGHTGIEHAIPLYQAYDDVIQFWSASETAYTPTFVVAYGGLSGETYWYEHTKVWQNERLLRFVPDYVVEPLAIRRIKAPEHHYNHFGVARFAKTLRDKGVRVHIGAHGQREGLAAHWELWMMEQGGFTPWETLRAGTIDGAKYLGMDDDIGSLEVGKLADLVVIEGNPLKDLRQSEFVAYTMINGRLYDAESMNEVGNYQTNRQAFFFESGRTTGMHPATQKALERKAHRLHWRH